jgi:hypothetical protein
MSRVEIEVCSYVDERYLVKFINDTAICGIGGKYGQHGSRPSLHMDWASYGMHKAIRLLIEGAYDEESLVCQVLDFWHYWDEYVIDLEGGGPYK